jgi:hypothetical protein
MARALENGNLQSYLVFFQQLMREGHIKEEGATVAEKPSGCMRGLKYSFANHGLRQTFFVKDYSALTIAGLGLQAENFDALLDFAAFSVLKQCGARTPVMELKGAKSLSGIDGDAKIYSFSADIAQHKSKHPGRDYQFVTLADHGCEVLPQECTLAVSRIDGTRILYHIDAVSTARTLLLAVMLGLKDLNNGNVGFVISADAGVLKAKLAIIDFGVNTNLISTSGKRDFAALVQSKIFQMKCVEGIYNLPALIRPEEYALAFSQIEERFAEAMGVTRGEIFGLDFVSQRRKEIVIEDISIWWRNFEKMKVFSDGFRSRNFCVL